MSSPTVSVLMTAYNREEFIAEAIESVLASDFTDFELIIVDDCSKDSTREIINKYAIKDDRIKFYKNEKNLGDYPNRNMAASYATGKYIQFVDSDDMLKKDGLRYTVENMKNNEFADFGIYYENIIPGSSLLTPNESIQKHFFSKSFLQIGPGATILKRSFFEKIGKYPTEYGPANDNYFNLLAASSGNILLLKEEFFFYRIHDGQEKNNHYSYLINYYRYLRDALLFVPMQLSVSQKKWIDKKNKRRFSVNIIRYFLKTLKVFLCSFENFYWVVL